MLASLSQAETLDAVLEHYAHRTPTASFAVDATVSLNYFEANQSVDRYTAWLARQGVHAGDRVALIAAPGIPYVLTFMAVSRLGAIYVGVNPRYSSSEMGHAIGIASPAILLYAEVPMEDDLAVRARAAAAGVPVRRVPMDQIAVGHAAACRSPGKGDDIAVIVFTSGSTGKPKGVALHHGGLIAAAICQHDHLDGEPRRYLSNLPINHVGEIMNLTMACLVGGGALVFQAKFDPGELLRLIASERVQTWLQVPMMFTLVANHPDFTFRDLSSLNSICIGGGAVSRPTLARLRSIRASIFVEYGQTEVMSTVALSAPGASDDVLLNSIGRFDPRFEVRIADEAGKECDDGRTGEIQARGNCVLRRYWGDEQATQHAFTADGWLKTGDLAFRRPDGNYTLKERLREMIKSGGYNVYPRQVKTVIETHPAVTEVVVYGVADEVFVEAVHCAIECRPDARVTSEDLRAHCAKSLANHKTPKRFTTTPALPRLSNGKIDRAAVRSSGALQTKAAVVS